MEKPEESQAWKGWVPGWESVYNALPAREDVLNGVGQALTATTHVITKTATATPSVVHRYSARYSPGLHETINKMAGYQQSLLMPQSLKNLRNLIEVCKVDPNYNRLGYNALHAVASGGTEPIECLQFLLRYRININSPTFPDLRTPLHRMIAVKNIELTLFFIDYARNHGKNIDFSLQDENDDTPLLLATKMEQEEIALCIIEQIQYGSDIAFEKCDRSGKTALDHARRSGKSILAEVLSNIVAQALEKKKTIESTSISMPPLQNSGRLTKEERIAAIYAPTPPVQDLSGRLKSQKIRYPF